MKANELRIGNYYRYLHEESESIHVADWDFIKIQSEYDENPNDDQFARGWFADAIPLTEQWLLDFGFTKNGNDLELLMQRSRIGFIYYGGLSHQLDIIQDGKHLSTFAGCSQYVHQLQNLYFALTGKELERNEETTK